MFVQLLVALFAVLSVASCPVPLSSTSSSSPTPSPSPSTPSPSPSPTPTYVHAPSRSTSTAAPSSTPSSSSPLPSTGEVTWYTQGGNAGSCGQYHKDTDLIAALSVDIMQNLDAASPYCGKNLQIYNPTTKKTVVVTIEDKCEDCNVGHVDLSTGAFQALSDNDLDLGVIDSVTFTYLG